jgi:hypothetical protein
VNLPAGVLWQPKRADELQPVEPEDEQWRGEEVAEVVAVRRCPAKEQATGPEQQGAARGHGSGATLITTVYPAYDPFAGLPCPDATRAPSWAARSCRAQSRTSLFWHRISYHSPASALYYRELTSCTSAQDNSPRQPPLHFCQSTLMC